MSVALLASAGKGSAPKLYPEDVFSTYLYTGNGSTQTINNGIDLAGQGGMVWIKARNVTSSNRLFDTGRGFTNSLSSNLTSAQSDWSAYGPPTANSTGFTIGDTTFSDVNKLNDIHASWTFRKAPKFFDIVTYTGNGVAGRQIPHNLGCEVGMMVIKDINNAVNWIVYHRGTGNTGFLKLNLTDAFLVASSITNNTTPSISSFTVGTTPNAIGQNYVAYLYAHDTSADGIIQCGSFTTDGSGNATVNLGWEPQYLMVKRSDSSENWVVMDVARGMPVSSVGLALFPDTSGTEVNYSANPTATGLQFRGSLAFSGNYIYMAIRRPNKVPTSGTEVYNAIARTGTGAVATVTGVGFAPDLALTKGRTGVFSCWAIDRLRGAGAYLGTNLTQAEGLSTNMLTSFTMDGAVVGINSEFNGSGTTYINYFFKRAKGFFDIVCHTDTGVAIQVPHSLGVIPELIILKSRNNIFDWYVNIPNTENTLRLNATVGWETTAARAATATTYTPVLSSSGYTFVAYLFATLANVSKCFSYTGNGSSLNVECGFSTGARFVLCKRTDSTGDWFLFDSIRGIVAGNDPHLSLNTTAAEVTTDDSIDPYSNGFIVNQNATTNLNVNSGTYIGLAIA